MLITDYSFDVSAKTITLSGQNLAAERIMSIVNRTREVFYFRVGDSTKAISVAFDGTDTVITLNEDLNYTSHADTDLIQIIVTDTANLSDLIVGGELKVVDDGVAAIGDLIPEFLFVDGKLFVTTDLDLSGLATKAKQDDLIAKLPDGLTVIDGKLQTKPDIQFPSSYELGETSLAALENITAEIDKTGLATDVNQETTNTKLETISDKIPTFTFDGTRLTVKTELTQPLTLTELQGITVNVSEQSPLDLSGLAKESMQDTSNLRLGETTEIAPTTDTASSGLNGRLQRIAQRLTSLIGLFPASLGVKTAANSLAVALATDGVAADISGKIGEVQTSPTANTVLDRLKTIATLLSGTIRNSPVVASTSTLTNVASSATSVTLLSANTNRKTVIIINDSTATLYLKFDASAASITSYSLFLPPITNNIPSFTTFSGSDYAGEIRGIWSSANGFARITEVV